MVIENPKFLADVKLIKRSQNSYNDEDIQDEDEMNKELSINKFYQSFDIQVGFDNSYNKNFQFAPKDHDIVIQNDFIFALINLEVLSELNIPSVSFNIISKDNWRTAPA